MIPNGRPRPNVLLIVADELRADTLSCAGHPVCRTPNLDRLAAAGTRFSDCMVTQPTCTPSRASMLTGAFPSVLKSRMVGCHTPDDPRFLGHRFTEGGYRTSSIGKIHLVPQRAEPDVMQGAMAATRDGYFGFGEVDLVNGHGDSCFGPDYELFAAAQGVDLDAAKQAPREGASMLSEHLGPYRFRLPPEVHSSRYIANRTIELIDSQANRDPGDTPFFAHVSFPDPHHPFTAPAPWDDAYDPRDVPLPTPHTGSGMPDWYDSIYRGEAGTRTDRPSDRITGTPPLDYSAVDEETWRAVRASYYGMTSALDEQVGRILDRLESTGLASRTVVVFVADHGDYLGDHGFVGKGMHFDSALRVPLIVRGPGVEKRVVDSPASTVDLAPTLLGYAGIEQAEGVQGIDLSDALVGAAPYTRTAALTENDDDMMPVRMRTLTTADWKLTSYAGSSSGELYDRNGDPGEAMNLFDDPAHAEVRHSMQLMLLDEVMCAADTINGRSQQPAPPIAKWLARHNRPNTSERHR